MQGSGERRLLLGCRARPLMGRGGSPMLNCIQLPPHGTVPVPRGWGGAWRRCVRGWGRRQGRRAGSRQLPHASRISDIAGRCRLLRQLQGLPRCSASWRPAAGTSWPSTRPGLTGLAAHIITSSRAWTRVARPTCAMPMAWMEQTLSWGGAKQPPGTAWGPSSSSSGGAAVRWQEHGRQPVLAFCIQVTLPTAPLQFDSTDSVPESEKGAMSYDGDGDVITSALLNQAGGRRVTQRP